MLYSRRHFMGAAAGTFAGASSPRGCNLTPPAASESSRTAPSPVTSPAHPSDLKITGVKTTFLEANWGPWQRRWLLIRVDTDQGSVVFTGDTQPCQTVTDLAKGADIMLCMCWDDQELMEENGEAAGQCGTIGAARMAQEAGVGRLVLVHIGPHLSSHGPMEKGIGDIRRIYGGELIFSEELMRIHV